MKKVIGLIMVGLLLTTLAIAGLEQTTIESKAASQLLEMKSDVISFAGILINYRDEISVVAISPHLSSVDKEKLPALRTKVNEAIDALTDVRNYIEINWANLE